MSLQISHDRLHEIMKAFFTLTGICVTVFDTYHNILSYYPEYNCRFCQIMQSCAGTHEKCRESDLSSFSLCNASGKLVIHKCHAGLTEATFPLKQANRICGYIMFGQIASDPIDENLRDIVRKVCSDNNINEIDYVLEVLETVTYKTKEEVEAAATLLEACVSYLLNEDIIYFQNGAILSAAIRFIEDNLASDLSADTILNHVNTSRTKLYSVFTSELGVGVSTYIRNRRFEKARELLKTSDMSVADIALAVGFSDYNYFARVFKKEVGISPYAYKNL